MRHLILLLFLTYVNGLQHIAIITLSAYKAQPYYLSESILNKARYAQKHNYTLLVYPNMDPSRPPAWSKIKAIQNAMLSRNFHWIFWIDGDTIITNTSIPLQEFLPSDNFTHIVVSRDCQSINTGVMLWKASPLSFHLLDLIYHGSHVTHNVINHFWWEQKSFVDFYDSNKLLRNVTGIIPQKKWNSYDDSSKCSFQRDGIWSPGDFLVHFSGIDSKNREKLYKKYISQVS